MEYFVTLFDSLYLPQGIALYKSLERHADEFTLWVVCMDDKSKEVLDNIGFAKLKTISLSEIENDELHNAKKDRSISEYCWTITPQTPKVVFEREPTANRVTYLDADMYLLKSPAPIFAEFESSGKAVLITEHGYSAEFDHSNTCGIYCVQFMVFNRGSSELFREWWAGQCIDWCYARKEENKFGDQKYIEHWFDINPDGFHVLKQIEFLQAPWNATRFPYSNAIAWHFHGLKLLSEKKVLLWGNYKVPAPTRNVIYSSYIQELSKAISLLESHSLNILPQGKTRSFFELIVFVLRSIKNRFYTKRFSSISIMSD